MCSCGSLRVHLGALTLRFTADALATLVDTLSEAVATHAALQAGPLSAASNPVAPPAARVRS